MKKITVVGALVLAVLAAGCATVPRAPKNPPTTSIVGKSVTGTLIAVCEDGDLDDCKSFDLTLNNKTEETLEIDWNRSYYINNGRADGGLYFDGIIVMQRNNPRSPDIILPKSDFQKRLVPNKNFELSLFPLAHWKIKELEGKSHGVYLTIKSGMIEEILNVSVNLTNNQK